MQSYPKELLALMKHHQKAHCADYYYEMRRKKFRAPLKQAGQFLYLNRTCWNGLYRVNLSGEFNVPIGTKSSVLFEGESFEEYARLLSVAEINACDYDETIQRANKGDFLFVDPPYTVKHNFNGFAKYNENIFSWADQKRLKLSLELAARRGVKILLSNAHHDSVLDLFGDLGTVHVIQRRSLISGKADARSTVTEIAVTINYDVPDSEDSIVMNNKKISHLKSANTERRAC
jgi:DNA adenine methylase